MKAIASTLLWTLFLVLSILLSFICNSKSADIGLSQQCLDGSCVSAEDPSQQIITKIPIQQAYFTFYESYPMCCPDSPNYNAFAPIEDCDDFSCCEYSGEFAALGRKSFEFVENNNLVVLFDNSDPDGIYWNERYANKTIEISKMFNGKLVSFNATIADVCVDADCDNCCTRDASSSGFLLVMEYYTVMRNFGSEAAVNGFVSFRIL